MQTGSGLVVMGVSGCGKSSLGAAVAAALGLPLIEGDSHHSAANIAKMRAGVPLTDADRQGWLATLGQQLQQHPAGVVLTCSALRRSYREQLRAASPGLRFAFLDIDRAEAQARVQARAGEHFFAASLVDSQFATLEPPLDEPGVLHLQAARPLAELTQQVVTWWTAHAAHATQETRA
jgi:gluconokinase